MGTPKGEYTERLKIHPGKIGKAHDASEPGDKKSQAKGPQKAPLIRGAPWLESTALRHVDDLADVDPTSPDPIHILDLVDGRAMLTGDRPE